MFAKLTSILIIMFLIPILVVGAVSIYNMSVFSQQETARLSLSGLQQASVSLTNALNKNLYSGIRPIVDQDIRETISHADGSPREFASDQEEYLVRRALFLAFDPTSLQSMYLFSAAGQTVSTQPVNLLNCNIMSEYTWYADGVKSQKNYFWGDPIVLNRNIVLPYLRRMADSQNKHTIGYVMTNVYESTLHEYFSSFGDIILINKRGTVISAREKTIIGKPYPEALGITSLPSMPLKHDGFDYVNTDTGRKLLAFCYDPLTEFTLIQISASNPSRILVKDMLPFTTLIVLVCSVLCIGLAFILSLKFIKPLKHIRRYVDKLDLAVLDNRMSPQSNDEIGMLMSSFNNMAQRLKDAKQEILLISDAKVRAEYRAIELQINPHFLYNTLSSINWFAEIGENQKIIDVSTSLSTLFRISVNQGRSLVRIRDEIRHVRCYLDILKIRHVDEFHYQIDVDPTIFDLFTIKILLQPLVENAIQHGIRERNIPNGIIAISAFERDDSIHFEIADNGNIPQERIHELNSIIEQDPGIDYSGIGILNVHMRIRYYYGNDYGLSYEKRDEMTVAMIKIPRIEDPHHV